jgi:hypothetical protein
MRFEGRVVRCVDADRATWAVLKPSLVARRGVPGASDSPFC